jgi:hypothetical protein
MKPISPDLKAIYETAAGLYKAGVINKTKLREFYELVYENSLNEHKFSQYCENLLRQSKKK